MKRALVDVLVVHHQQPLGTAVTAGFLINREEVHAIMVHADLLLLVGTGIGAIGTIHRILASDRRAPGQEGLGCITLRHDHTILGGDRHSTEAKLGYCLLIAAAIAGVIVIVITATGRQTEAHNAGERGPHTALEQRAALHARGQHFIERSITRMINDRLIVRVKIIRIKMVLCHGVCLSHTRVIMGVQGGSVCQQDDSLRSVFGQEG
jgi:hypothetical protein